MSVYPHLEGLRRLSPCCHARVAHDTSFGGPDPLHLICLRCRRAVPHFILRNRHGQDVWPVKGKLPPAPPRPRRRRRRALTEPDPEPYTLHLDRRLLPGVLQ